ncbi:MAG: 50S ribosomal protein L29 [Gemmatimonadaceae bacterium]
MRAEEIREMTLDDIKSRVAELEEERFRLRFRSATEPLENPLRLRTIRRDIARLKTVMTEKAKGAAGNGATEKSATARSAKPAAGGKRAKKEKVKNG